MGTFLIYNPGHVSILPLNLFPELIQWSLNSLIWIRDSQPWSFSGQAEFLLIATEAFARTPPLCPDSAVTFTWNALSATLSLSGKNWQLLYFLLYLSLWYCPPPLPVSFLRSGTTSYLSSCDQCLKWGLKYRSGLLNSYRNNELIRWIKSVKIPKFISSLFY